MCGRFAVAVSAEELAEELPDCLGKTQSCGASLQCLSWILDACHDEQ